MVKISAHPSQETLREIFTYSDGDLINKKTGKVIGSKTMYGYIATNLNYKFYLVHRLIWIYHHGDIDKLEIDHIDRNRSNNKLENLRTCTSGQNKQNMTAYGENKGGCPGVNWKRLDNLWAVTIGLNYENIYLGSSKDYFEACCLRKSAENKYYHWD